MLGLMEHPKIESLNYKVIFRAIDQKTFVAILKLV